MPTMTRSQRQATKSSVETELKQQKKSIMTAKATQSFVPDNIKLMLPSAKGTVLVLGIYVFFLAFGYCQESVYKVGEISDKFSYPMFIVALLCFGNVLMSGAILLLESYTSFHPDVNPPQIDDVGIAHKLQSPTLRVVAKTNPPLQFFTKYVYSLDRFILKEIALSSFTYVLSMLCTNYALGHVNYPTQVLVKSAKSVPVILGGFVFFGKRYPFHDYVAVCSITAALVIFNMSRGKSLNSPHQTLWGLGLLCVSLFCDSLTGPRQDRLLSRVRISSTHLMFLTNIFGSLIAFAACLVMEGLAPIAFCLRYPEVLSHIALFCLSASLGQCFIFASLTTFGSLHLTLITTTRKFFTVWLSVLSFGHVVTTMQWICVAVIFVSLFAQSYCTKKLKLKASMPREKSA